MWQGSSHDRPQRQAEELHRRALQGSQAQLGATHPGTLSSLNNLAAVLEAKGSLEEAKAFLFLGEFRGLLLENGGGITGSGKSVGVDIEWPFEVVCSRKICLSKFCLGLPAGIFKHSP